MRGLIRLVCQALLTGALLASLCSLLSPVLSPAPSSAWAQSPSTSTSQRPFSQLIETWTRQLDRIADRTGQSDVLAVEIDGLREEASGLHPTVSLIGFATSRYPDGTVLTVEQARAEVDQIPEQAGAIRWGKGDPRLEQIYTAPDFRRRRLSIKMIHVADILNEAAGWGGYLYGGGELTSDGQHLANAWTHSARLQPQSIEMPPME